jgi:hypothetical protein
LPALTNRITSLFRRGTTQRKAWSQQQMQADVPSSGARSPLRLAMIGTPRSGNTWLRRVLATAYEFGGEAGWELAAFDPGDLDWGAEPARSIVQVHISRDPDFESLLAYHNVRPVVPTRHPFDVLISILQYATHVHDTYRWLLGEGGNELAIRGLDPNHPAFLDYARGPRAAALLDVSQAWSQAPGAVPVRYEDLVNDPLPTLEKFAQAIGQVPVVDWATALERNTKDELRKSHGFGHIWKGRPGLWRSLLTAESVETLGPLLDIPAVADPNLTPEQALATWKSLN